MISFVDPAGSVFLANLDRIEQGNEQTQAQISSGHTINQASDSPDQISQLLGLEANLSKTNQVQTNLTNAQNSVNVADSALTSALQLLDQASSVGAQGASSITTAQSRQQLAQQVQDIFDQIVSITQTSVAGRFVFSGDTDTSASYRVNSASANGVDRLSAALNTSQVEDSNGIRISVGLTAGQIFDHRNSDDSFASDNVFLALTNLKNALNNNDTAGITSALSSVSQASAYVNLQQGFYGSVQNRLTESLNVGSSQVLALKSSISQLRDTDLGQAAIELTQGTTQYQAALQARSKVPHTSLFDFLG